MEFLTCEGTITLDVNGAPVCSGTWIGVADGVTLSLAELSGADLAALLSAGLVTMCLAFGFRVLRKSMGF